MLERLVGGLWAAQRDVDPEATVIHECRRCGTTLEADAGVCPYCGPTETVRYEF